MKNLNTFKLLSDYESEKSGGVLNTPNVSFVEEDNSVRYLLENKIPGNFENGYEWIDLGLPSGLKWATCNVGADSPEKAGLYFAWGETVGYTGDQVKVGERTFDNATYNAGPAASISTNLAFEHDAARANLGGKWRMPNNSEFHELRKSDYTTTTWTTDYNGTGVKGCIITSKSNGNSIFLPAVGYYEKSTIYSIGSTGQYWTSIRNSSYWAYYWYFNSVGIDRSENKRCYGRSVRGVCA